MTAAAIAALEFFAPSLLGGSLGIAVAILRHPMAGRVIKLGKRAARGEHLSKADKQYIKQYNAGRTDAQLVHGWW